MDAPQDRDYYRPLVCADIDSGKSALRLAGSSLHFDRIERLRRDEPPKVLPAAALPPEVRDRLTAPRAPIMGLTLDRPRIMGILNVTPDSFSDGGHHEGPAHAMHAARRMVENGADLVDVGGESTRPGAAPVPVEVEISRIEPTIQAITAMIGVPVSVDTRKACVAQVAVAAGAGMINDVSGLTFDPVLAGYCARNDLPVCIMHSQGDPQTMQDNPRYDDVVLDVYDFLDERVAHLEQLGLSRDRIVVDPGIGFGKTEAHNLALLRRVSLFHALGCPILVGASRKRFIGRITGVEEAPRRVSGSVAVAQVMAGQGVQFLRVHDVPETRQALAVWAAIAGLD